MLVALVTINGLGSDRPNMEYNNAIPLLMNEYLPNGMLGIALTGLMASFMAGVAANATLIVNMVPIVMPFFLFFLLREGVNRHEVAGTLLAILGVVVLTWGDYQIAPGNLLGDFVCFLSMLLFGLYLAYGRVNRGIRSLWLYLVPLYAIAGVICLLLAMPYANPFAILLNGREILLLLGLALIPTVLGHSLLNFSLKHINGQAVSVCNLGQFVFAGIMARQTPEIGPVVDVERRARTARPGEL
jgi:drug/metabolite transporter (DMT)-like permease